MLITSFLQAQTLDITATTQHAASIDFTISRSLLFLNFNYFLSISRFSLAVPPTFSPQSHSILAPLIIIGG